jgi:hypothetical protein
MELMEERNEGSAADASLDDVARGLADGTLSRGRALRLMGAALMGGALTSIPAIAWAKPKPGKCKKDKQCPDGQVCVDGFCQCPADTIPCGDTCCSSPEDLCCNGVCTNVVFDRNNCGACGNRCGAGEDCCGQRCVPLNTNQNCGSCGNACLPRTEQCVGGVCRAV